MKQRFSRILLGIAILGSTGFAGLSQSGCSTPVYSGKERLARINRNVRLEWQMMNDDIDTVLLLRPVTGLTAWNVP